MDKNKQEFWDTLRLIPVAERKCTNCGVRHSCGMSVMQDHKAQEYCEASCDPISLDFSGWVPVE